MIDYELAKKLKEAGFPIRECKNAEMAFAYGMAKLDGIKYLYPTLSELIEACGPRWWKLEKTAPERGSFLQRYVATGGRGEFLGGELIAVSKIGKTPEIAVALLWLALNKEK